MSEPALRAPDYIKIAAGLIAACGWCGSSRDPIADEEAVGLSLTTAVLWAIGGRGCMPRDLSETQSECVVEIIEHLEGPLGLGGSIIEYERNFAGASADNVAAELLICAVRYQTTLVVVS